MRRKWASATATLKGRSRDELYDACEAFYEPDDPEVVQSSKTRQRGV